MNWNPFKKEKTPEQQEIEKLESQNEWIPVENRLPDNSGKQRLVFLDGYFYLAYYNHNYWVVDNYIDPNGDEPNVTHWREITLPEEIK